MAWEVDRNEFTGDCDIVDNTPGAFRTVAREVTGATTTMALSRACVIACAPELHYALSDMIAVAKKELPEHIWEKLRVHEKTLQRANELYEQHRSRTKS